MVMPKEMKDKRMAFTARLSKQIQDINGDPKLSGPEKQAAIEGLKGAPKEDMYDFLNNNFRTGPGLDKSFRALISKNRPKGGPK